VPRDGYSKIRFTYVLPIAERHASSGLSLLDLIQEGNLGLMRALDNFTGTRLDDFSAYAAAWIEDTISEAIARSTSKLRRSRA